MPLILVAVVPAVVVALLLLSAWIEDHTLAPDALVVRAGRGSTAPDVAERVVAMEAAALLDDDHRR